ncbi:riboflavin biosynthesis protein RibD [Helicobacter sp. 12S02634-8]|uniref:bifunctional diaminohydroxyphosphoribosylaminopyrimidine deaminase/5-amino-6-(5-phosphoribosylamino)uracil reductase RibD n=1 Tax=Helicobacter sp. 12S02634-8 TaxID=1476199 RepID=UPI000BA6BB38|nr:bifunctional diaminohydroxyphosphoribosylaminopyrimidine deaminase/5-amino-6-(5-phosphoribosylamino)uracil reductase RibD [Helicobacter sp. 12S02634-8]PAF46357.1 riboflavin biosynthesis protein RibD [Helicobacter sp. 12S02634-8]
MLESDRLLMGLCLQEAWKYQTLTFPNPAVGAMVVGKNGTILSLQAHTKSGDAHAEINALKIAYETLSQRPCPAQSSSDIHAFLSQHHQGIFNDCSIYVTLEPCNHYGKTPPCAELLEMIKPQRIIIGAPERQGKASGGRERLEKAGICIQAGVLQEECEKMLDPFLCYTQKGHFNLFKIAQRLNGDYKSGVISGEKSREFTHNQRTIADRLIVSGATLRTDRPILDARYAALKYGKKAPHIKVLSTRGDFDPSIAAFGVEGRCVEVCHHILELGLESGFNIIEGGWGLFESLYMHIDMVLMHCSASLYGAFEVSGFPWAGKIVYVQQLGDDALLWIKKS